MVLVSSCDAACGGALRDGGCAEGSRGLFIAAHPELMWLANWAPTALGIDKGVPRRDRTLAVLTNRRLIVEGPNDD